MRAAQWRRLNLSAIDFTATATPTAPMPIYADGVGVKDVAFGPA